jgi:hypothetical protein
MMAVEIMVGSVLLCPVLQKHFIYVVPLLCDSLNSGVFSDISNLLRLPTFS